MAPKRLTVQQRKEIFQALVATQDMNLMTIPQTREQVMRQFGITDSQLRQIEDEGVEKEWPPLDEAAETVR